MSGGPGDGATVGVLPEQQHLAISTRLVIRSDALGVSGGPGDDAALGVLPEQQQQPVGAHLGKLAAPN